MKWWLKTLIVVAIVAGLGVGSYVGIKKVLGDFLVSADNVVQRKVDELVGELDGAIADISGFRDSLANVERGLSDLAGEIDRSAETATRIGVELAESIERKRELEEILGRAETDLGILAEGIDKGESALDRFREYLDRN